MVDIMRPMCGTVSPPPQVALRNGGVGWEAPSAGEIAAVQETTRYATAQVFHVDAFAGGAFEGNPAAVCLLRSPRDDAWMQGVAAEMNLSETAFVLAQGGGFALRWFTPAVEVPLCGHATLAAAHVLWETGRVPEHDAISFDTCSGGLVARRVAEGVAIDLPARPVQSGGVPDAVFQAIGEVEPRFAGATVDRGLDDTDYVIELESESAVRGVQPDLGLLRGVRGGLIVTAPGAGAYDVVSRYFAPWWGIDEDPVTGSAHCALVPFWTERLGKDSLVAHQASARGGTLRGRMAGDRVVLSGGAVTLYQGLLLV